MLLPLLYSNVKDPRSHWSAQIADIVALELKSLLPSIYNLQELNELAIPLEPFAHTKLVRTQAVVQDRQNCEKSTWVALLTGESIGSGTSSEGIVSSSTTKSFVTQVPK